jgi:hypothetical protein
VPLAEVNCRHCHAVLSGPYCHECGQKALADDALTARAIAADAWEHATALDFKTLRTLRAVFVPGLLTAEFIAGHRRPYLAPMKVYLLCGAIFFFAAPYTLFTLDGVVAADTTGLLRNSVESARQSSGLSPRHFAERFDWRFQSVYTVSLALSVAALALMTALLFRANRQPAAMHLVFALHYVAFLYLLGIVIGVGATGPLPQALSLPLLYAILAPYMFFALRRVFRGGTTSTIVKTITVLGASLIVDSLVNLMAFMLTLRVI